MQLEISKKIFNSTYFHFLFDYDKRINVYYGGAGSGKSAFVTQKLLIKLLSEQRSLLVVRKTAKSNKESTFKLFIEIIKKWSLLSTTKVNKSTNKITLINGSEITFEGLDDVEKLKSITGITDIFIEEATEITEEDFAQLNLRLRARQKHLQIYLAFNPVSKANWVYQYFFSETPKYNPEKTFILKTTYKDNRFLSDDYINAIESYQISNPTYYKIYALGEFATLDKLVFNNFKVQPFDPSEINGELLCGLDWGYVNDPTAFIASILDEKNRSIYIFDSWGCTGLTNDKIAEAIKSKGYAKSTIICDSAEEKSIAEVRDNGLVRAKAAKKGKGSIISGIMKLQSYNIIINPNLVDVIEEFNNYSWKKNKDGIYINEPIDAYNHYIDALRYSLQCTTSKLRTLSKYSL